MSSEGWKTDRWESQAGLDHTERKGLRGSWMELQAGGHSPSLGVGGSHQRFLKSYSEQQHRHCPLRPGRDSRGQSGAQRGVQREEAGLLEQGLEPADVRYHQVPGKRLSCTESGLNAAHRSGVTLSERVAATGESEQILGERCRHSGGDVRASHRP